MHQSCFGRRARPELTRRRRTRRNWFPVDCATYATHLFLYSTRRNTEMHIYEQGGHGFGLGDPKHDASRWSLAAEKWMRGPGLMPCILCSSTAFRIMLI